MYINLYRLWDAFDYLKIGLPIKDVVLLGRKCNHILKVRCPPYGFMNPRVYWNGVQRYQEYHHVSRKIAKDRIAVLAMNKSCRHGVDVSQW